jgi:hypothetical protein
MFRPYWPSSGVQVIVVKDSAAHCNAVFFPPIVVASTYFGKKENRITVSNRILNHNNLYT